MNRCKNNIEAALKALPGEQLPAVPPERIPDCLQLVGELAALEIEITPKQVQQLWRAHSARFAVGWARPCQGNAEAIEVEAIKITRALGKGAQNH